MSPALAGFFAAAATTLDCTDGTSAPRQYAVKPEATGVSIGSDSFTLLKPNAGETATAGSGDNGLVYRLEVIDGETIQLQLDRQGKLSDFSVLGAPGKKMYSCSLWHQDRGAGTRFARRQSSSAGRGRS